VLLPAGDEVKFFGHGTQVSADVAATVCEYVAVPQSEHAALPLLDLYLPATHAVQAPAGPVVPALQAGHGCDTYWFNFSEAEAKLASVR
jgi:hypothetical protein